MTIGYVQQLNPNLFCIFAASHNMKNQIFLSCRIFKTWIPRFKNIKVLIYIDSTVMYLPNKASNSFRNHQLPNIFPWIHILCIVCTCNVFKGIGNIKVTYIGSSLNVHINFISPYTQRLNCSNSFQNFMRKHTP